MTGESVSWPASLARTTNSRVYIVGHGVPLGDATGRVTGFKIASENGKNLAAAELVDKLKGLLDKVQAKRIALVMCYGGGWKTSGVAPERSFAYEFAKLCVGLASDITARVDEMGVVGATLPTADIEKTVEVAPRIADRLGALHTMKNQAGKSVRVLGAHKEVDGFQAHGPESVVIFKPNASKPEQPSFAYRKQWSGE